MDLNKKLEEVEDQATFLIFVKALHQERCEDLKLEKQNPSSLYGPTHKGWENTTIEAFLEAAIAWAEDTDFGNSQNIKQNDWYKLASFLYCGKIYE